MIENNFVSHEISDLEKAEGFQLSTVSIKMMDNYISEIAHQILSLTYRPSIKEDYFLALRFAQGQLAAAKYFRDLAVWNQNGRQGDEPTLQTPNELA